MSRPGRLVLGIITVAMILVSSLAIASQPADDEARGGRTVPGGGLGHNLKR